VQDAVVTVKVGRVHGSGFFVSPDGFILTAAHVVSGRDSCIVKTGDGNQIEAKVLRIDQAFDVALIKVQMKDRPHLKLTTGPSPTPGSEVYAIGTPLLEDLDRSVSKGIVSGLRSTDGRDLIQTDAAVNQGNSGGPLVDRAGRVIGIVSLKVALPGFEGIGFAVPTSVVVRRLALGWQ
jgi:serine protease Do